MTTARTDDAIARVQHALSDLASCLLPRMSTARPMHGKLYVARLLVMFLELRRPGDPIVRELRAEVELVTSRLVELGIVNRGAFERRSSPQIGGSFGGCARLSGSRGQPAVS